MKMLFVLVLVGASAYGFVTYGFPAWTNIQAHRVAISEVRDVQAQVSEIRQVRDDIINRYNTISDADLAKLEAIIPEDTEQEDLYIFFQLLVEGAGTAFDEIVLSRGSRQGTTSFQLSARGSYDSMRTLLHTIENNIRIMDVESLTLTEDEAGLFIIKINGVLYNGF